MNNIEKESVKDDAKSQKISASTIFWIVLVVGILLMGFAYFSGYFTVGEDGGGRMGPVSGKDSAIVTKSDTIQGN